MKEVVYEKIKTFIDGVAKEKTFASFVQNNLTTSINDISRMYDFFDSEDYTEMEKAQIFSEVVTVKKDIERTRKHIAGFKINPYEEYEKKSTFEKKVGRDTFIAIFDAISFMVFSREDFEVSRKARSVVAGLDNIGLTREEVIEHINLISSGMIDATDHAEMICDEPTEKELYDIAKSIKKIIKPIVYDDRLRMEALCYAYLDARNNDILIENKLVFDDFISSIRSEGNNYVAVVAPSPFFVRKMFSPHGVVGTRILFVIEDDKMIGTYRKAFRYDDVEYTSIDNLENFLKHKASQPDKYVLFANNIQDRSLVDNINAFDNHAKGKGVGFIFDYDRSVCRHEGKVHKILAKSVNNVTEVKMLPSGIQNCTQPERKMLVRFEYGGKTESKRNIVIKSYSINNDRKYQALYEKSFRQEISQSDFNNNGEKIRSNYYCAERENERKTGLRKNPAEEHYFTKEITIYSSLTEDAAGKQRLNVYVKKPLFNAQTETVDFKGKIIISEKSLKRNKLNVETIVDAYPYCNVKHDGKYISIRDIISREFGNAYKGISLTLKSLLYFYEEYEYEVGHKAIDLLKELFEKTDLGDITSDKLTSRIINHELDLYFGDASVNKKTKMKSILSDVIDFAISKGHGQLNCIAEEVEKERYERNVITEVTNNLRKANFSEKEMRAVTKMLEEDYIYGNKKALATIVRLLTGLPRNIVCAFCWGDFAVLQNHSSNEQIYYLNVRRQLVNDGTAFAPFVKTYSYRKIPISSKLANLLKEEKNKKMEELKISMSQIEDYPIVSGGEKRINGVAWQSPRSVSEYEKNVIDKLEIPGETIEIPDNDKGTIEKDLAAIGRVDIFSSNYRFLAKVEAAVDESELAYLTGTIDPYTLGRNYVDYTNPAVLEELYIKQNRIASVIKRREEGLTRNTEIKGMHISKVRTTTRTDIALSLTVPAKASGRVILSNWYGMDVTITEIERKL